MFGQFIALHIEPGLNFGSDILPNHPLLRIERPRCPKCQSRVMLARIEPGPAGSDLRTFECRKCEHVRKAVVEADPMKSTEAG
jgi:hypothetical protein